MSFATCIIHGGLGNDTITLQVPSTVPGTQGNGLPVTYTVQTGTNNIDVRGNDHDGLAITITSTGTGFTIYDVINAISAASGTTGWTWIDYFGGTNWTNDDANDTQYASGGVNENVGSSHGTSTATGIGKAIKPAVGSSTGTSTDTAVGKSTAASVGNAAGTSTASASASNAAAVGSSTGTSTDTAVGASTAVAVGSAGGTSSVLGDTGLRQAVGLAFGTSGVVYNDPQPILAPMSSAVDHVERGLDRLCQYAKEKRSVGS